MLSIQERLNLETEAIEGAAWQWACALRCAIPGEVVSFNPAAQTCVVQPTIQEIFVRKPPGATNSTQNIPVSTTIAPVQDVPIIMMRTPGWSITFPIVEGTQCLLISADACIDGWWQNGGVNAQYDRRRHDISDSFALFGPWSQNKKIVNYSTSSMQIRSDDQTVVIDFSESGITITSPKITINTTGDVDISAGGNLNLTGTAATAGQSGATFNPLLTSGFLSWFKNTFMPTVTYNTTEPTVPTTGLETTVFKAE